MKSYHLPNCFSARFLSPLDATLFLLLPLATLVAQPTSPNADASTAYEIASRDQNSQLLQRVTWSTNEDNEVIAITNWVTQIETGLNYRDPNSGEWLPSEEVIELLPGGTGAVARKAPHTVVFPPSLVNGVIQLTMPEGTILRSRPTLLSFFDGERSVFLAELKADSMGYLLPSGNQVIYPDAFSDGINADILLTFTKSGLEADVVFRRPLPEGPEDFGLRPDARLQLLTEFFDTVAPVKESETISPRDGLADSILRFGSMAMVRGKGFSVGTPAADQPTIPVYKSWQVLENRSFLVEEIPWRKIEPQLKLLAAASTPRVQNLAATGSELRRASPYRRLPPPRLTQATAHTIQWAKADLSAQPGFILDYTILSSTNTLLKADTTYFVSGTVSINNLVAEGGVCVKFTNTTSAKITVTGTIDCQTGPYRPAVFTHYLDNTVGETIATGSITNYYGTGLQIDSTANALHDLRFSYASSAVTLNFGPGQISLTNMQFVSCGSPINMTSGENTILMDNALCYAVSNVIKGGYDNIFRGQHLTVNQCNDKLFKIGNGNHNGEVYLTNSILAEVLQLGDADIEAGSHNVFYNCTQFGSNPFTNASNPFQTVGASSFYLIDGSTNRNAGTTNISASLLAALRTKTTYPPVEITTNITGDTVLSARAIREQGNPDIGFAYAALDYVLSGRTLTNATLVLSNGVALGTYGASTSYGLAIGNNGKIVSEGLPTSLNWIARYNMVQEQATTNWSASTVAPQIKMASATAQAEFHFTGWSLPGGTGDHFNDTTDDPTPTAFTHSQFGGGKFTIDPSSVALTNCVWERVYVQLEDNADDGRTWSLFNNLFYGGTLYYRARGDDPVMRAYDNLFDQTTITKGIQGANFTHDYNGYVTNQNRLSSNGAHDVVLTNSPVYQTGALGKYYYPTNDGMLSRLLNVGSRNATNAALYHFTVTTNQVKETNSQVDIGFHYVAVDTNGIPFDTDGDGIPDYADPDSDGDSLPDVWELSYFGNLSQTDTDDSDGDCLTNLQEYQAGSNPVDPHVVTSAPVYQVVPIGANASFSITMAQGCLHYQWYRGGPITGATNSSITLTNVQLTNSGSYLIIVTSSFNYFGYGVTRSARLVVLDAPAWTVWTNYIANTNGMTNRLWTTYTLPTGWPTNPPLLAWNTNCLLYGKTGFTGISQCNEFQVNPGQIPVTVLTKRHGYTRGHGIGPHLFSTNSDYAGKKVWFCTAGNQVVEMTVAAIFNRAHDTTNKTDLQDYTMVIFTEDLPSTITPLYVMMQPSSYGVYFRTCQHVYEKNMSANLPPFTLLDSSKPPFNDHDTYQFGDSGSPDIIPMVDGSLVFVGGRSTDGPSTQMQADMDILSIYLNLNTNNYQLNWYSP